MPLRNSVILLAAILGLAISGQTGRTIAGPKFNHKSSAPPLASLSQNDLHGAMQGYCGVLLDIDNDDKEELVVGAPYARFKGGLGALLIYEDSGKGFGRRPEAVLKGEGNLGWSLVSLGDVAGDGRQWFASGAHSGSGPTASLCGTVHVYRGGRRPSRQMVLEGEQALDKFGYALAAGDLNADGAVDLVVGAPLHSPEPSSYQQGAVYIYMGPDFGPAYDIKIPGSASQGSLGFAMATGDINNDGVLDLLLGASGKVVGYYGGVDFPLVADQSRKPDVTFASRDRGFGRSLAMVWDVDDDGFDDLAVGAYQAEIGNIDSGRLFIVKGGSGYRAADLDAEPAVADLVVRIDGQPTCGQFGAAVLPIADMDGDNVPDLAVGAVHADGDRWPVTGGIFLFSGADLASDPFAAPAHFIGGHSRDMHLGTFLAQSGAGPLLVAGAPTERGNTGGVYLYNLNLVHPAKMARNGRGAKE